MHILRYLTILASALILGCPGIYASGVETEKTPPPPPSMANPQKTAQKLAQAMELNEKQSEKFVPMYVEYIKDLKHCFSKFKQNKNKTSNEDTRLKEAIETRFHVSREILDIREKYYKKYSKYLTIRQIDKMYETEKKIDSRESRHKSQKRAARKRTERTRNR